MQGSVSLQQRLEGHVPSPSARRVTRASFRGSGGALRRRIDALRTSDGRVLRTFSVAPGDANGSAIISNGSLYTVELNAGIRRFALP